MIIQSARLAVGLDLAALERHVFRGPANENIVVLHGDADDLAVMRRDAVEAGKRYAIRHFKISPGAAASRVQAADIVRDLAVEFGFKPGSCVVVEHHKPRAAAGGYERHWHVLAPEWDPLRRRVLDAHWMRPRQEKIARLAELRLGHAQVTGRWNAAVARALTAAGQDEAAKSVARLVEEPRPGSAYTASRHQAAARHGVKLPEAKAMVARAWAQSTDGVALEIALAAQGMHLRAGEKAGVWVVEVDLGDGTPPVMLGALHRLVRQPKRVVAARLLAAGITDDARESFHAEPQTTAQGAGPVQRNKEHDHVENYRHAHAGRSRRAGGGASGTGRGREPASLGQKGADPGPARLPADGVADRPPDGSSGRGGQHGGAHPGRPDRGPAGDDRRRAGAAKRQALCDRARTRQALGIGRQPVAAAGADSMQALLERMEALRRANSGAGVRGEPAPVARNLPGKDRRHGPLGLSGGISLVDPAPDVHARRRRWIALCLRQADNLSWVPDSVAAHIVTVAWRAEDEALVMTLDTGARVVDRFDRIELAGAADDVAIAGLVACVQRRGWQAVRVSGSDGFRAAAARALLTVGIAVENPPLCEAEVAMLRAGARQPALRRPDNSQQAASARAPGHSGSVPASHRR
jgi:hypothetical protein